MADEVRPIDANAFIKAVRHCGAEWNLAMAAAEGQRQITKCHNMQELAKFAEAYVKYMPTLDYIPVVRCKDCKNWRKRNPARMEESYYCAECGWCEALDNPVLPSDFCSHGKKRPKVST